MNLHCSQTSCQPIRPPRSLIPYEFTLFSNLRDRNFYHFLVWFPYEFALLSNVYNLLTFGMNVWFPYEFALLSNSPREMLDAWLFDSPTNLHCSQTQLAYRNEKDPFDSPTNLHCSQTYSPCNLAFSSFDSPTNLHCSQTYRVQAICGVGLIPLRICTALKR